MKQLKNVIYLILGVSQLSSCIVEGPYTCTSNRLGSLGIEDKLMLRIKGKKLASKDIRTIYVDKFLAGTKLGVLYQSDTIISTRFLYSTIGGDTNYFSIFKLGDSVNFYKFTPAYDYIVRLPLISKEYKITDWVVIDTSYTWVSKSKCTDDPVPFFNTIRYKLNYKDTSTSNELLLEATP